MRRTPLAQLLQNELERYDANNKLPRYKRLYEAIRIAIIKKRLLPGTKLPSSRDLAQELGASRNMVVAAYDQLESEGFVGSRTGSGTYVNDVLPNADLDHHWHDHQDMLHVPRSNVDLTPDYQLLSERGRELTVNRSAADFEVQPICNSQPMDLSVFPINTWLKIQNQIWRRMDTALFDYDGHGGYQPLRRVLTEYLAISRGVELAPEQVLITAGTQQSMDLIARLLTQTGDLVWAENPCYWGAWSTLCANQLNIKPIDVDDSGIAPTKQDMAGPAPKLIYVTPSHQYPTGAVMSTARRQSLIEFAKTSKAWILEDDYDSEFRYSGKPLVSLQGMANDMNVDQVLYMGTFSKVMYPGIKMSYLVVPKQLVEPFQKAFYYLYRPGQLHLQACLAEFIEQGHFTSYIRNLRQTYLQRRTMILAVLERVMHGQHLQLIADAGLHIVFRLPDDMDDEALARECLSQDLWVKPLSRYYIQAPVRKGLIVGFAYVNSTELVRSITLLGEILNLALAPKS